jgi:hypothetical protein
MSQHCDIAAARLADCLTRHTAAMQERVRTFPRRSLTSITQEFIDQCKQQLGLAEPRPKNLFRFLRGLLS